MIEEPELAFCRDYHGWDYNYEYHSRAEAKKEFEKWQKENDVKERMTPELDQHMLDKVKEWFKEADEAGALYISDRGDWISPRYEIFINKSKVKGLKEEKSGCYGFEGFSKQLYKDFKKEEKEKNNLLIMLKIFCFKIYF